MDSFMAAITLAFEFCTFRIPFNVKSNFASKKGKCTFRLIEEVGELEHTIRQLELKSEESEDRLRDLQHTRMALEKEINIKRNTIGKLYETKFVRKVLYSISKSDNLILR